MDLTLAVCGVQEKNMSNNRSYCMRYFNGVRYCYQNGQLHRIGGPAVDCSSLGGGYGWYQNGRLHRVGGSAIENVYGRNEWWENGELIR